MNEVWRAFMEDFQVNNIATQIGSTLSQSERTRLQGLTRTQRQKQYLLSRAMMRVALSHHYDLPLSHWQLQEGPDAPPSLMNPVDQPLYLSLSHSADCIMLAISAQPVGLDVEYMRADRPFTQIARRVFTPEQQESLTRFDKKERMKYFYRLWTEKEALVKIADPNTIISMYSTTPWATHEYSGYHTYFDDFYVSILSSLDVQVFSSYDLNSFEGYEKNYIFSKYQQH